MVKNIFNSFSSGFFHFLGKVFAIIFIGFVIYTIVSKLDVPSSDILNYTNLPYYRGGLYEKNK